MEAPPNSGLVVAGYVLALLMPLLGLVIALAIGVRSAGPRSKHGTGIFALSMVMIVVYGLVFAAGS